MIPHNTYEKSPSDPSLDHGDKMQQYHALLEQVLQNGCDRQDRTGTGTRSIFGHQMRFDLSKGLPLVTSKKVHVKSIIYELLWFLSGNTNVSYLQNHGVRIWNEWAAEDGSLGPVYGKQWRSWNGTSGREIDQIGELIDSIKKDPESRRLIVSAWNPDDLPISGVSVAKNIELGKMALAPCHAFFQFYVANGRLSCQLYQRSNDLFLGAPFNICQYAILTMMIAQQCDLLPGDYIHTIGDAHIYSNHFDQVKIQLARAPRELPHLNFKTKPKSIFSYCYDDFEITGYDPHPAIKAEVSV